MSASVDKFKIGLFVVLGSFLGIGLLIWLGASRYLESANTVVTYFSESVQGLEPDSSVKFRGVDVGRVASIRLAPDKRLIEVVINLEKGFPITEDLGVKTSPLGLTGRKYLELDRYSQGRRRPMPELGFKPPYPVITGYPSEIREWVQALEKILSKANSVDIATIGNRALNVATKLDKMLDDKSIESLGKDAGEAARQLRRAASRIDEEVKRMQASTNVNRTFDKASAMMDDITRTSRDADRMIRKTDQNLTRLFQKLEKAADDLRDLTEVIKRKPSLLIYGTPESKSEPKR